MINTFLAMIPNSSSGTNTITLTVVLWAMYLGLLLASAASLYNKAYVGDVVRALVKRECHSADAALTLEELGIKPTALRRRSLRASSTLRKYVKIANEDEGVKTISRNSFSRTLRRFLSMDASDEVVCDLTAARFYMPEDKKDVAEIRYGKHVKRSSGIIAFAVTAALGLALVLALMYFIPEILELLDDLVSYVKNAFGND